MQKCRHNQLTVVTQETKVKGETRRLKQEKQPADYGDKDLLNSTHNNYLLNSYCMF